MNDLQKFKSIQQEGYELFQKKNKDYSESYKTYGLLDILVRLNDKINRCISINKNNVSIVSTENLKDTLIDLHNYSTMAIIELDETIDAPIISSSTHYTNSL
jgi:hypothetical protein